MRIVLECLELMLIFVAVFLAAIVCPLFLFHLLGVLLS